MADWLLANTIQTIKTTTDCLNSSNTVLCYSDSIDYTDKKWIDDNITGNYLFTMFEAHTWQYRANPTITSANLTIATNAVCP